MSGYDILRQAAARQREDTPPGGTGKGAHPQLDLPLDNGASHPKIACAVDAMGDPSLAVQGATPAESRIVDEPGSLDDNVDVEGEESGVERSSLRGDRPFWAHAADAVQARSPSRALVPVVIDGETGRVDDEFSAERAFGRGGRRAGAPFTFGFRFDVSRPRMLLALLTLLVLGVVANNISARYRGNGIGDAQAQQHAATLADSLKLLEPGEAAAARAVAPEVNSQAAPRVAIAPVAVASITEPPATERAVAPDPRRAPADINEYVQWALPQVNPNGAARSGLPSGPIADASARALPRVEPGSRRKAPAAHGKRAALPPKRPVPDRIEMAAPAAPAPVPERSTSTPRSAATQPSGPIDLNTVYIDARLTRDELPYSVRRIADQEGGRGAFIVPREQQGAQGAGVWAQAGTSFPNGWELVGVEGNEAIFLQKDGRSVRVPVSR
jgi:hypothetical protein